ncbi:MAG: hypothetical protein U0531_18650 [Dehalococcoidia bacterium]
MTRLRTATHVVVVGDDLEASHPVAALRLKRRGRAQPCQGSGGERAGARCATSPRRWLRCRTRRGGGYAHLTGAKRLADPDYRKALAQAGVGGLDQLAGGGLETPAIENFDEALAILRDAVAQGEVANVAIVFAPGRTSTPG